MTEKATVKELKATIKRQMQIIEEKDRRITELLRTNNSYLTRYNDMRAVAEAKDKLLEQERRNHAQMHTLISKALGDDKPMLYPMDVWEFNGPGSWPPQHPFMRR